MSSCRLEILTQMAPDLRAQEPMHNRSAAPDHAVGTRACAGGRAKEARPKPECDAPAARDGRASLRHDEGTDGRDALPDEGTAARRDRDGITRTRLQFDTCAEYYRCLAACRGGRGLARPHIRLSVGRKNAHDGSSAAAPGVAAKIGKIAQNARFRAFHLFQSAEPPPARYHTTKDPNRTQLLSRNN
jgi:hypothetical protein